MSRRCDTRKQTTAWHVQLWPRSDLSADRHNSDHGYSAPLQPRLAKPAMLTGVARAVRSFSRSCWLLRVLCSFLLFFLRHGLAIPATRNREHVCQANVASKQGQPMKQKRASMHSTYGQHQPKHEQALSSVFRTPYPDNLQHKDDRRQQSCHLAHPDIEMETARQHSLDARRPLTQS